MKLIKDYKNTSILLLLLLLSNYAYAGKYENYENTGRIKAQQQYRDYCRAFASQYAAISYDLPRATFKMLNETSPNSPQRTEAVSKITETSNAIIESARIKSMNYRQSSEPDKMLYGTAYDLSATLAVQYGLENPTKPESWFQDRIFSDCVKN
jgi:hypothetical protein